MRVVYFDCFSGAAGDMILGALIDAGAPVETVRRALRSLDVHDWELTTRAVTKGGIRATHAHVTTREPDVHRTYADVVALVESGSLSEPARDWARRAFRLLADAEARVHGHALEDVHFHEVGAVDAIVDVVGSAVALDHFAPERVVTSPLATGCGYARSAHGTIPVPAPAVLEILRARAAPLRTHGEDELLTPTGAAIIAAVSDEFGSPPELTIDATGYGAGTKDRDAPNVVRVIVGETTEQPATGTETIVIETNIDDMSPELIPYAIESLLAAGAHDAWVTPATMKKGRPGFVLSVLGAEADRDRLIDVIYRQTTTFGLRVRPVTKDAADRAWIEVEVEGQPLRVKLALRGGEVTTAAPEYDDAVRVARATGLALKDVYRRALEAATAQRRR